MASEIIVVGESIPHHCASCGKYSYRLNVEKRWHMTKQKDGTVKWAVRLVKAGMCCSSVEPISAAKDDYSQPLWMTAARPARKRNGYARPRLVQAQA